MNSVYNVIIRPIVSERSFDLMEQGKYTFEVAKNARRRRSPTPWRSSSTCTWSRSTP